MAGVVSIFKALSNPNRLIVYQIICRKGSKGDGITIEQICAAAKMKQPAVSHHVARLAAAGLVDPSDGLRITARGSAAIAACHPAWRQAQRKARRALHPAETRLIGRLAAPSTKSHRHREGRAP